MAAVSHATGNNQTNQIPLLCQWTSASDTKAQRHPSQQCNMHRAVAVGDAAGNYHGINSDKVHIGRTGVEVDVSNKLWTFTLEPAVYLQCETKSQSSYYVNKVVC